jgi:predicted ferric reductase
MPWELHPFTAATVPGDKGELAFIIRVRDGFTRRMKEKVDLAKRARGLGAEEECSIRVTGAVEGPYGQGEVLSCHEAVVIFAGGSLSLQVISKSMTKS